MEVNNAELSFQNTNDDVKSLEMHSFSQSRHHVQGTHDVGHTHSESFLNHSFTTNKKNKEKNSAPELLNIEPTGIKPVGFFLPTHDETPNDNVNITSEHKNSTQQSADHDQLENSENTDEYDVLNDPTIKRDAADHLVAFFVHVFLTFFLIAFGCAIVGAIFLVSHFGFFGILGLSIMVIVICTILFGFWKIINAEPKYKPIKYKLTRWKAIAKAVVANEITAMQLELREMYLLTNEPHNTYDGPYDDGDVDVGYKNMDINDNEYGLPQTGSRQKNNKRPRSFILQVVMAPFGGLKNLQKRNKRKKRVLPSRRKNDKKKEGLNEENVNYIPSID